MRGRVSLPKKAAINWSESRAVLMCWDRRTPPDATTKLPKNFERIARRRDILTLKPDGSFDFVNVEPAEYELSLSVLAPGDQWLRPTYSRKITITRAMFLGKSRETPIDLGEISLKAAAR